MLSDPDELIGELKRIKATKKPQKSFYQQKRFFLLTLFIGFVVTIGIGLRLFFTARNEKYEQSPVNKSPNVHKSEKSSKVVPIKFSNGRFFIEGDVDIFFALLLCTVTFKSKNNNSGHQYFLHNAFSHVKTRKTFERRRTRIFILSECRAEELSFSLRRPLLCFKDQQQKFSHQLSWKIRN